MRGPSSLTLHFFHIDNEELRSLVDAVVPEAADNDEVGDNTNGGSGWT